MKEAVIVDAVRTPFGKYNGSFRDTHPQDLAAAPLQALQERNGFDPGIVDDVMYGCVKPVFEQGSDIGRIASMVAGWGDEVPGFQLDRLCGSGQQTINLAAANVRAGFSDVVVAGGVEHMTRVPMSSNRSDGASTAEPDMSETYFEHFDEITHQGESAERVAEKWDFSRRELDEIAVESQRRWKRAHDEGRFDDQLVPVETELDGETIVVEEDEHPRPGTDVDSLSDLPPAFRDDGEGVIHAGNSSGIVDGSSAVLVTSRETAREYGWEPMARIVQTEVVGVDPVLMLTGPIPATEQILEKADMVPSDIDLFEVNEAFASVIAAWLEETGLSWEDTNVNGGAIAHGHPLGATGSALITKLAHELERTGQDRALSTMCIAFGQGVATIIERV
ncbi:acetyl-CoA C-acetyltransferase [Natronorubrum sediminis]|uniref:Acetyl-CoA C-acetyltransferase n=1 Tax=Natronorubrum sediminis TaxID=640943 RepID=A0A1H6G845_9EURY|nr:thiolase family protein [Natronorubrum sediminis]SEH18154.1 acetyl-CoA C-acetyltransferase [Natronorubrum sediminis]